MRYSELRKELLSYYELKLSKGQLMAINEIKWINAASEEELVLIKQEMAA